jgi:hypothetical protein
MVRLLCLFFAILLPGTCSALDIQHLAACSGVVLRLRGDIKDGDYSRLKSHFKKKEMIVGLDLSSDGGDLDEGLRIENLGTSQKAHRLCCRRVRFRLCICLLLGSEEVLWATVENRCPLRL